MSEASWPARIGRYEVLGRLGSGGMAEVLLCRLAGASGFERLVTLKRVLPALAQQAGFTSMFLDEARIVASIRHANVVQVFELLEEGGELCIVMEYLEGESLASLRTALASSGRALPPALACWIVAEAAAGVHAAHQLEVVHRDLSPQNVFLTYDGAVKLLDFGVAHARGRLTRTESGTIKGKLEYMSPEQAAGKALDARSDVFALGVVLWELLAGKSLFRRPSVLAIARAVAEEPVPPPSRLARGLPPELDAACLKALARPLGERHQTAAELRRELLAIASKLPGDVVPGPDALAPLMGELFAARVAEKRELVEKARAGGAVVVRPEPIDIEDEVEVRPTATSAVTRRSLRVPVAAALLAAAGVTAFVLWPREAPPALTPPVAVVVPLPQPPQPAPEPPPPPPEDVRLRVETLPAGARVELDGRAVGVTPLDVRVPKSEKAVKVVVKKAGYQELQSPLVPDVDQKLTLKLTAARRGAPKASKGPDPLNEKW